MRKKKCIICKKEFNAIHPAEIMCSEMCRKENKKNKNKEFLISKKKKKNEEI